MKFEDKEFKPLNDESTRGHSEHAAVLATTLLQKKLKPIVNKLKDLKRFNHHTIGEEYWRIEDILKDLEL